MIILVSLQDGTLLKKAYPCDVVGCSKQFSTPYRLKAHIRSHTGDMFECESEGCDKAFITQSDLNKHMKTHSGMKPFHCTHTGCEKVYTTAHHLKVREASFTWAIFRCYFLHLENVKEYVTERYCCEIKYNSNSSTLLYLSKRENHM